ncbi:MAG: DNA primase [Actinomycetales bacterium]
MAGLIRREDVEAVRERTPIDEVVGDYVTLRPGGVGVLKGLCPFHDERTPSFNVRPQVGRYHCFGCGEGGDVLDFIMKIDQLTFTEAVERLAAKAGVTLRYEDGSGPDRAEYGRRQRLIDANAEAEVYFREQLVRPGALIGREFLSERGFDREAAEQFSVGFAPSGWDNLVRHLRGRGFRDEELTAAGVASPGRQGLIDRFRGRLVWPIRDLTGVTVGFGARRLEDSDNGPKYLNTPETALYKKSGVLYGIDLAKREIAKSRQVVVVEGYTDVMAMHLSGVTTAVATCGTAFGTGHIKIVRRMITDDDTRAGEIVFTFDGDEAGRKAALKAFSEDQRFVAQTFVAVEPRGMDPCELRLAEGADGLARLLADKEPLFEFVIRSTLAGLDLDRAEARVQGLRACAPLVAQIRDPALRPEYARRLAGWLGLDVEQVRRAVAAAGRGSGGRERGGPGADPAVADAAHSSGQGGGPQMVGEQAPPPRPDLRDPVVMGERQFLQMVLQFPDRVDPGGFDAIGPGALVTPVYRVVDDAIRALGGPAGAGADWVDRVTEAAPDMMRSTIVELAVADLPERRPEHLGALADGLLRGVRQRQLLRERAEAYSRLQRAEAAGDHQAVASASAEMMRLQRAEHDLRAG